MIRHILIVAWRNICKYKVSAGIAVVGLAMGLLCFVLCNFCARLFFSIDKVFPNYDRMAEIQIKVGRRGVAGLFCRNTADQAIRFNVGSNAGTSSNHAALTNGDFGHKSASSTNP